MRRGIGELAACVVWPAAVVLAAVARQVVVDQVLATDVERVHQAGRVRHERRGVVRRGVGAEGPTRIQEDARLCQAHSPGGPDHILGRHDRADEAQRLHDREGGGQDLAVKVVKDDHEGRLPPGIAPERPGLPGHRAGHTGHRVGQLGRDRRRSRSREVAGELTGVHRVVSLAQRVDRRRNVVTERHVVANRQPSPCAQSLDVRAPHPHPGVRWRELECAGALRAQVGCAAAIAGDLHARPGRIARGQGAGRPDGPGNRVVAMRLVAVHQLWRLRIAGTAREREQRSDSGIPSI